MYHLSSQIKNRADSSAASVLAYRIGYALTDPYNKLRRYPHRAASDVQSYHILNWENHGDPVENCQNLVNEIGRTEVRINSRLWRELEFALPHEGTDEQRIDLALSFGQKITSKFGIAGVLCIHFPPPGSNENWHAHLPLTTRRVVNEKNQWRLGEKARELDSQKTLEMIRKLWEIYLNFYYRRLGVKKTVSCLSNKERELNALPTIHVGPASRARKSERKETNRHIEEINAGMLQHPGMTARNWVDSKISKVRSEISKMADMENTPVGEIALTKRQKKQLKALIGILLGAGHEFSPETVPLIESKLTRGAKAGAPLARLQKNIDGIPGDKQMQMARELTYALSTLFRNREVAAYREVMGAMNRFLTFYPDFREKLSELGQNSPCHLNQIKDSLTEKSQSSSPSPDTLNDQDLNGQSGGNGPALVSENLVAEEVIEDRNSHETISIESPETSNRFEDADPHFSVKSTFGILSPDGSAESPSEFSSTQANQLEMIAFIPEEIEKEKDFDLSQHPPAKSIEQIITEASSRILSHEQRVTILNQWGDLEVAIKQLIKSKADLNADSFYDLAMMSSDPNSAVSYILDHKDLSPTQILDIHGRFNKWCRETGKAQPWDQRRPKPIYADRNNKGKREDR